MEHVTHESLLLRLQDVRDAQAWDQFHGYYRTFILNFAGNRGCSQQMAQDVLQETMITLTRVMPNFSYNPLRGRFRTFLLTIVTSRIVDAFRREIKYTMARKPGHDSSQELYITPEPAGRQWEDEWEREWQQHLLMQALRRVQAKIKPYIYDSFRMYVLEKRPAAEVTETLGIPENTIYQHRRRVIDMLRREITELRAELGEE